MKIQYVSDLHLEIAPITIDQVGDILVLAGDICSSRGRNHLRSLLSSAAGFDRILMVIGNHEGYNTSYDEARIFLRVLEKEFRNFRLLDRESIAVYGVMFHGCTLWSNPSEAITRVAAQSTINDYRCIKDWSFEKHCKMHEFEKNWLMTNVRRGDVVITHFCPSRVAIDVSKYGNDIYSPWFASQLDDTLIKDLAPSVWISGHTHHTWKEKIHDTIVAGNCRGYARVHHGTGMLIAEVPAFDPLAIIDLGVNEIN